LAEGIRIDQQKETIVFISAFEIRRDFFRLDDLSLEREGSKIALSLGDKSIYAEQLKQTVYKLLKDNHLAYVLGDIEEYRRCFLNNTDRTLGVDITEVIQQCSREHQTTFLVTAGANGIYGVSDGVICFLPPNRVVGLVNTNGAGDAAAGAFVSTHLATGDLMQSLEYSIREAEAVLRSVHGIKAGGNV
jgi:sugar/nucleoside kinase (ribokinase family)